jgi:hypothetical protein
MGVTGMAKSRQSNAIMTFMAHNDFACFARFARKRRNKKQGILEKSRTNKIFIIYNFNGGHKNGKKSRQSNAVMMFMAHNYFARFVRFAWRRRNEKQGILEKSCQHTIFILSNFNGGHRNGKKSFLPAVSSQNGQIDTKPKFQNFKMS